MPAGRELRAGLLERRLRRSPRRAWSRSARMSSMCSMPTLRRTSSGVIPPLALLLLVELRVGRRGRVDGQALGIAHVGQVREELQRVDELPPRVLAALDAEDDHRPALAPEVLLVQGVHRVALEAREPHPLDARVRLQVRSRRPWRSRSGDPSAAAGSRCPGGTSRRCRARCRRPGSAGARSASGG